MTKGWTKAAWRAKPRVQMPDYPDQGALNAVEAQLSKYPPLVFAGEARRLKKQLALAAEGKAFLLQGGDLVWRRGGVDQASLFLLRMPVEHPLRDWLTAGDLARINLHCGLRRGDPVFDLRIRGNRA